MTAKDIASVVESVAPIIREFYAAQAVLLKAEFDRERESLLSLIGTLEQRIAAAEERPMQPGPKGEPGERGQTGLDGKHGTNGKDGEPGLHGKDGRDGVNGKDGAAGLNGKDGQDGLNGKDGADGLGLTAGVVDRDGHLVLTLSDGQTKDVGPVVGKDGSDGLHGKDGEPGANGHDGQNGLNGKDGEPGANGMHGKDGQHGLNGKDGEPGLGFDDFTLHFDEAKGYVFRFARGEQVKDFPVAVPFHAGIWEASRSYPKGAMVTFHGGSFVALNETKSRPDETAKAGEWRQAARRGMDGKNGKDGKNGDE